MEIIKIGCALVPQVLNSNFQFGYTIRCTKKVVLEILELIMAAQLYKTTSGRLFHAGQIAIITVG